MLVETAMNGPASRHSARSAWPRLAAGLFCAALGLCIIASTQPAGAGEQWSSHHSSMSAAPDAGHADRVHANDPDWLRGLLSPAGMATLAAILVFATACVTPGRTGRACRRGADRVMKAAGWAFSRFQMVLHALDPRVEDRFGGESRRVGIWLDLLCLFLVAGIAYAALRLVLPAEMPIQVDQSADLVNARHYFDSGRWPSLGQVSSFGGLYQGNVICLFWLAIMNIGLDVEAAYPLMLALNAVAVSIFFTAFRRRIGWLAAGLGTALFLCFDLYSSGLTFVWKPSLLPLPLVIFLIAAMMLAERPGWVWALLAGVALAVAAGIHVVTLLMLPVLLTACGMGGTRRAFGLAGTALAGLVGVLMLMTPDSWILNAKALAQSGWMIPGIAATGIMILPGIVMAAGFGPSDKKVRGIAFMHVATIVTLVILLGLSVASGRQMEPRYFFPALPGAAVILGQASARHLGLLISTRNLVRRVLLALAAVAVILGVTLMEPVTRFRESLAFVTLTFPTMRLATSEMARQGLTASDMKWAVQTPEYMAFIRTLELFPPQKPSAGTGPWYGETAWQMLYMGERPVAGRLPVGFWWFESRDGRGLLMERLRPWVRRDLAEICFENVDPAVGRPGCARALPGDRSGDHGLDHVDVSRNERVGPLETLASRAWHAFTPNPGSKVRMIYRLPVQPDDSDAQRIIFLVDNRYRAFEPEYRVRPDAWQIVGVEGAAFEGRFPRPSVTIRGGASGASAGTIVFEYRVATPGEPSGQIDPPTWFEIRPGSEPIWHPPTAEE